MYYVFLDIFIDRQEGQRQTCNCPVDREELVDHKVNA